MTADELERELPQLRTAAFRIARSVLLNDADAEDAVQDTLMRVWLGFPRFRGESLFSSWFNRIAHNSAIMVYRRRRTQRYFHDVPEDHANKLGYRPDTEGAIIFRQRIEIVERAAKNLTPAGQRAIRITLDGYQVPKSLKPAKSHAIDRLEILCAGK